MLIEEIVSPLLPPLLLSCSGLLRSLCSKSGAPQRVRLLVYGKYALCHSPKLNPKSSKTCTQLQQVVQETILLLSFCQVNLVPAGFSDFMGMIMFSKFKTNLSYLQLWLLLDNEFTHFIVWLMAILSRVVEWSVFLMFQRHWRCFLGWKRPANYSTKCSDNLLLQLTVSWWGFVLSFSTINPWWDNIGSCLRMLVLYKKENAKEVGCS